MPDIESREASIRTYHEKHIEKWADKAVLYCADCYLLSLIDSARMDLAQYTPEQFCCYEVHEFESICPRTGRTFYALST
jgi:hypothetical protein